VVPQTTSHFNYLKISATQAQKGEGVITMPEFDDIQSAIQTINGIENGTIDPNEITLPDDEIDESVETVDKPVDNEVPTDEKDEETEETKEEETEETDEQEEEKKTQTPEENRKFAEQRRQQELEKRVQEELDKRLGESPELQKARLLQEEYGLDLDTVLEQMELQRMAQVSQETGRPLEDIQREFQRDQQLDDSNRRLAELEFKLWQTEMRSESLEVQKDYPMLTSDDMQQALDYMTGTLGTTSIPLKQAVMAVHGDKIMESLRTQARNEVLAEKSGRKTPLQPQGGKSPSTPTLTDEERFVAKQLGISEEDYLKYK